MIERVLLSVLVNFIAFGMLYLGDTLQAWMEDKIDDVPTWNDVLEMGPDD